VIRQQVGNQVRELRRQKGLTQEQLSKLSRSRGQHGGIARPQLARLEAGEAVTPDLEVLADIAAGLKMGLGELLWPVLWPEGSLEAEANARERFTRDMNDYFDGLRRQYVEGLGSQEAQRIFNAIAQLTMAGRRYDRRDVRLVVRMIEAATAGLLARQTDESPADLIEEVIAEQRGLDSG
jgi:transcriptional regulator with XRE-family HTH domain